MGHSSEVFIGIDMAKARNAIAVADGERGGEASASRKTTEMDQVQAARMALSSAGFTDRVDRTTANFASNTFSQTSTAQSMSYA